MAVVESGTQETPSAFFFFPFSQDFHDISCCRRLHALDMQPIEQDISTVV